MAFIRENEIPLPVGYDIYTMDADGADVVNLTNTPSESEFDPAWSPDGSEIVFATGGAGSAEGGIFVMKQDGSDRRQITDIPGLSPIWSPDGQRIAFEWIVQAEVIGADIYTIRPDGTDLMQLTTYFERDGAPDWSPDGSKIVFERTFPPLGAGKQSDVWAMNADGSGQTQVTYATTEEMAPVWSPDGQAIAYRTFELLEDGAHREIRVMDTDGSDVRTVQSNASIFDWQAVQPVGGGVELEILPQGSSHGDWMRAVVLVLSAIFLCIVVSAARPRCNR